MLTAAARSFLITTSLICSAALLSACGGSSSPDEDGRNSDSSSSESARSSSDEPAQSSSSESAQSSSSESAESSSSEAPSTEPDAFSFEDQEDVEPGTEVTSEPVVIEGMDDPVAIEITGGYYAINSQEDDAFTDQPGEIEAGDELTLRTQAPANGSEIQEVTVIIGSVSGLWRVSTPEDTEAPQAAFAFPTPMSATDAESLTVRGTAEDALSQIDRVTLTVESEGGTEVYTAETDDDFVTWSIEVQLAPGENRVQLATEDVLGNQDDAVAGVTVHRQSFDLAFPSNDVPLVDVRDVVFDEENDRLLVATQDFSDPSGYVVAVVAVDLDTGERSVLIGDDPGAEEIALPSPRSLELDHARNRLLLGLQDGRLATFDFSSGEREVLAGPDVPSSEQPSFDYPKSIMVDPEDEGYAYVVSSSDRQVIRLNLETGERQIIPGGELVDVGRLRSLAIGPDNRFAYVNSSSNYPVFRIDLETGEREELSMEGYPRGQRDVVVINDVVSASGRNKIYMADGLEGIVLYDIASDSFESVLTFPLNTKFGRSLLYRIALDEKNQTLFFAERNVSSTIAVDLETREYVVVSRSVEEDDD